MADNGQQVSALAAPGAAPQGSNLDSLYGGDSADIFEFGNRTMVMDATKEDYVSWAGFTKQITGGVQQFWMEGNWAYYTPFSGIQDPIRFPFLPINFLHRKSLIVLLQKVNGAVW